VVAELPQGLEREANIHQGVDNRHDPPVNWPGCARIGVAHCSTPELPRGEVEPHDGRLTGGTR
jgi:hypothetical protein